MTSHVRAAHDAAAVPAKAIHNMFAGEPRQLQDPFGVVADALLERGESHHLAFCLQILPTPPLTPGEVGGHGIDRLFSSRR